jgi:hypothetical protein
MSEVAGDIARQAAAAPAQRQQNREAKAAVNGVAAILGTPTFRLVDNPKWYDDKFNKGTKWNMRLAHVEFTLGGKDGDVMITGSIYFEKELVQDNEGRTEQLYMRFSPPKGVTLGKGPTADNFKESILDAFDTWKANLKDGAALGRTKVTAGRRAVAATPAKQ